MKPNIVFTIADDQRGSALGCADVEPVRTPCLDALAARGVRCARAYHHGASCGAVCAPSRAMLHTGLPHAQLDPDMVGPTYPAGGRRANVPPTLCGKLQHAGYHCFATGKWHNGVDAFHASFNDGDNIFFGGMADHWFTPVHAFDSTGRYPADDASPADGFSTDVFGQTAVDFIHSRKDDDQPFVCYCAFTAPHDPRTPVDAWRRQYNPTKLPLPENFMPAHPFDNGELAIRDERLLGHPRDPAEIRRGVAEYYAMISHMDAWIGRIHQAVADIGQLDNTIIIHTADHGLAVGQHGLLGKQNMYEHSVRVPLLLAGPRLPHGAVREGLCYQHDLHPTLLELADAPAAGVFFESLLPMLNDATRGRSHVTSHYYNVQRMACDDRYKLIEYRVDGRLREQLFDLAADPWEMHDLIDNPAHAARLGALRSRLPDIAPQSAA